MVKAIRYFPCKYENPSSVLETMVNIAKFQICTTVFHEFVVTFNKTLKANLEKHINLQHDTVYRFSHLSHYFIVGTPIYESSL